jgi:crotonobetainyl-CoA:carnitine CoA-transferase CaiB-like acyl-CoA transferase
VLSVGEALTLPQTEARHMLVKVPVGDGQEQAQIAHPLKFSRTAPSYRHIGAPPGTHTVAVLRDAGYSAETIQEMARAGLFGDTLPATHVVDEEDSDA